MARKLDDSPKKIDFREPDYFQNTRKLKPNFHEFQYERLNKVRSSSVDGILVKQWSKKNWGIKSSMKMKRKQKIIWKSVRF